MSKGPLRYVPTLTCADRERAKMNRQGEVGFGHLAACCAAAAERSSNLMRRRKQDLAPQVGFEPTTRCLEGSRSIH